MRLLVISLFSLFFSLMLVISGNSYLMTLVGVQLGMTPIPATQVGYIMTGYSVGFVLGALLTPKLLIKVGHIRAFAALASLTTMAALSYPLTDNLWAWAALRLLGGFSVAGLFIAIESWFSAVASDNNRATLFSLYQVAAYSSAAGGQLLLDVGLGAGPSIAFTLSGLLLIAAIIPLSISRMQSPPMDNARMMSPLTLWQRAALGLSGAFFGGILLGGFYSLIPVYGALSQLSTREIAQLMSISVLSAMLFAWPIGWLCDRVSRSSVMLVTCLISAAMALSAYWFAATNFLAMLLSASALMAGIAGVYSISVAITNDLIDPEERVGASSTLLLGYGVGSIIGPLSGSALMQAITPESLFLGFAALLGVLALFTRYRQKQMPPIPVEEQEHFIHAIPETQVNVEFDPRTEDLPETELEALFPEDMTTDTIEEQTDEQTDDAAPLDSTEPQNVEPETQTESSDQSDPQTRT